MLGSRALWRLDDVWLLAWDCRGVGLVCFEGSEAELSLQPQLSF